MNKIKKRSIVNATPHPVTFRDEEGNDFTVEPSGFTLPARAVEEVVGREGDVVFVRPTFIPTPQGERELEEIREKFPGHIVVGSMISSQAYDICAMVSAKGFERKSPAEKRMNPNKFTRFF